MEHMLISKEYLWELLKRIKVGVDKEFYNPTNCYNTFYLVIKFEDWVDILMTTYKEGGDDVFFQNTLIDTYNIIKDYKKSLIEYHKAYKYFSNELLILNELSLLLYNTYKVEGGEKVTHNHSPKLFLPLSSYLYSNCKKILIKNIKLPQILDMPDKHKGYSNYFSKKELIEIMYSNFMSIYHNLSDDIFYVNDI